jgi:hypothetical protein
MGTDNGQLNWIAGFIWNIAEDGIRDATYRVYRACGTDGMIPVAEEM